MAEASKKPKLPRYTTPKGTARFPRLNKADEYKGKETFNVQLILEGNDVESIIANAEPVAKKAFEDAKASIAEKIKTEKGEKLKKAKEALEKLTQDAVAVKDEVNDDAEPTGRKIVRFKMNASYSKDGETIKIKPQIFDSQGNHLKNPPQIWGGSVLKVSYQIVPYYNASTNGAGASLRMSGVQIIKLVSGGGASAEAHGFGKEEDGYMADPEDDTQQKEQSNDKSGDGSTPSSADEF